MRRDVTDVYLKIFCNSIPHNAAVTKQGIPTLNILLDKLRYDNHKCSYHSRYHNFSLHLHGDFVLACYDLTVRATVMSTNWSKYRPTMPFYIYRELWYISISKLA